MSGQTAKLVVELVSSFSLLEEELVSLLVVELVSLLVHLPCYISYYRLTSAPLHSFFF